MNDSAGGQGSRLAQTAVIRNKRGLHARAAAKLVTLAERFSASIEVAKDGQPVSARSIMGLMMLGAAQGEEVEVSAEGWDAKEAMDAVIRLIESGFQETD
ncbi:MAG TPA: HPr family phosphocarrier protein [Acetobacteraceae bacterium]|nr:HPr family phosphocarrier protein [Acetobacteraceae bacterium]